MIAIAVLGLVAVLGGCASRRTMARVAGELETLRGEVTAMQARERSQMPALARLQEDLHVLEAHIGELKAAVRDATVEVGRLRARLDAAEQALHAAPGGARVPAAPLEAPPSVPPALPPGRAAAPQDTPETLFSAALATFQAREHGQAVLELLDFIGRYPTHPLASSAQYWIGEAYYLQRDCRQALAEFQKVLDGPAGPEAPDALVKMGLCHGALRQPTRARELWQRVVRDHAESEAAERARALLRPRSGARQP